VSSDLNKLKSAVNSIEKIELYISGLSEDQFLDNDQIADAVLMHFINLGERLHTLSNGFKQIHPELPYKFAKEMRNVISHQYDMVSRITIWDTINNNILPLKPILLNIQKSLDAN
jgi:uncharacterized protein with HEPN domain